MNFIASELHNVSLGLSWRPLSLHWPVCVHPHGQGGHTGMAKGGLQQTLHNQPCPLHTDHAHQLVHHPGAEGGPGWMVGLGAGQGWGLLCYWNSNSSLDDRSYTSLKTKKFWTLAMWKQTSQYSSTIFLVCKKYILNIAGPTQAL